MILCIVGSYLWREEDIPKAKALIKELISLGKQTCTELDVISGECPKGGVDIWAKEEALRQGVDYTGYFPKENAKWAYMKRNRQMAEACDVLIRIVSKASRTYGSGYTMQQAKKLGKKTEEFIIG